jgi:hypothetical protein
MSAQSYRRHSREEIEILEIPAKSGAADLARDLPVSETA